MVGISSIFKYCSLDNHVMWFALTTLSIAVGALWYYNYDKARELELEDQQKQQKAQ
jgi:hypothetical protein